MSLQDHVMLDLETTGVSAGCCILSIGACALDLHDNFYVKVNLASCYEMGLKDLPSTIAWWEKQDPVAKEEAYSGDTHILEALTRFYAWFHKASKIWGNGADFDLPILGAAYEACGMEKPWKPYNGRCYRTIKNLYSDVPLNSFRGVKHNALEDARNQAIHLMKIVNAKGLNLG